MTRRVLLVLLVTAGTACLGVDSVRDLQVVVLSNRADLVSGGDALVEIGLPAGSDATAITVELNGASVPETFALRPDGRMLGLVEGLREGPNELRITLERRQAALTITNHPIGGPVFSGPQVTPWDCNTTAEPSLGPAIDTQCNAPTQFRYVYRTSAGEFAPFDRAAPYPDDIVSTTTSEGVVVPYIVRIERGTLNRGIHEIAVLFEPGRSWAPWEPQPQWNRKLVIHFGWGTGQVYRQGIPMPAPATDHEALSRGYLVVSSSMLSNGQHSNFVTAAETAMMLKEHVIDTYGPVRYTIGRGASGGALLQHLIADNYPGLLDGLLPLMDWEDSMSGAYREFADAGLLLRAFESSALAYPDAARTAIGGWGAGNTRIYTIESRRLPDYNRPDDGTDCAGAASYDSVANPTGVRCTFQDFMVGVLGRSPEGVAPSVYDNVGVQYGLVALEAGDITSEQFVDINVRVGGWDIDGRWQPERSAMDTATAALLHRSGQVTYGRESARVAELVVRTTNNNDYHYPFRTYVQRHRLSAANGNADNHAYWTAPPDTLSALDAMDRWLTAVAADPSNDSLAMKIVRNRPADLAPSCWIDGVRVTDEAQCDEVYRYFREPRTAAGDQPTIYTIKCALKHLRREKYAVTFTDPQWDTLARTFPTGVCDYTRPPVGFQANLPWLTYAEGPGGRPLGPAPVFRLSN
jgi:hypothetical protein